MGAVGFPRGVSPGSLWTVSSSRVPRRIGFGAALGRRFAAPEPSAQRFLRAHSGSRLLRSEPHVCRQVCTIPIASGSWACALRSNLPPPARLSSRPPPARKLTGDFGKCPLLSRLSRPSLGAEPCGHRRGSETASSAVFGCEFGIRGHSALGSRRQCSLG